ncbi:dicarboxylate/amino acid:cation symporter [Candidatus Nitronereus thalassa]|uniref:Dicarboxylate/amino acid:cation symporter n=1 Tax=Candidatus Nitronereus thalassa TaxID=3020898 RepID=A0ABU3K7U5_9BACT|nr:dicarboxylate/amino acid:cation symporter [Candidatus Nitronereus thalassa]MDT7042441.1 dicarboxylate/amino acid:cation symporter [Candidatus Nitronereus thalassa]
MSTKNPNKLLFAILLGITIGIIVGGFTPDIGRSVQFLGDLFLRALFVMVVPLVISSMIVGVSSLGDVRQLGPLGSRTVLFFMATTGIAVIIGLLLVLLIHPGTPGTGPESQDLTNLAERMDHKPDTVAGLLQTLLTTLVPKNLFAAMVNVEVLPLIIFSLIFGGVLTTLGEKGAIVIRFFDGVNDAIMAMVHLLMWTAPMGIGALIAGRLGEAGGFSGFWPQLVSLGAYAATVIIALLIHALVILPLILQFIGKQSVPAYARNLSTALTTAFSTSSSSATLPLTMEAVIDEHGISSRTARFVLPLGATINMNGTALYEAVAAVFIAQSYGIELSLAQTVIVVLTATLAGVGAAGIPEAGLVTMVIVLKAVGLPIEGIGLILVIDWFLDRCRTTVNVWGDAVGAAVIDKLENTT